ncbi:S8 family serine peptidase [Bdellovibrio sp. 22V]|uniref:S8 family serine peptidase n=1 Tax=Bdellovibrio sp. 22V TaxID=3044166 RepID=UPI0025435EC6|nr:S8 family serine peptidase [Bdellovibrio sp. 22V]WII73936.1 S8 family serine peptidase [Bdellovibrio sp. 22V]
MKKWGLFFLLFSSQVFASEPEMAPGEFLVKLKKRVSVIKTSPTVVSAQLHSSIKTLIPEQNIVVVKRAIFEDRTAALKALRENPFVENAEPNYKVFAHRTPDDPMLPQQWGYHNYGQADADRTLGVRGMDIGALKAWDLTTGSKNILVAVIDSGVEYFHADLQENMWVNPKEFAGKEGVDDDANGIVDDIYGANFEDAAKPTGEPLDDFGHGTHVAGTIGALGFDGRGVVGTAWHVRILPVKFLNDRGEGYVDGAIKALHYAQKMGAKIYSNSWGGSGYSENLKQAIEMTNQAGGVFVASAGNDSSDNDVIPEYPASYPVANIITVGAMNNRGRLSDFSNYGRYTVDVAAPGENILSTDIYGGYAVLSGTSMAVPHVSGIAVLLLSKNPTMKNTTVRSRIMSTTKNLLGGARIRRGLAYAPAALQNATTSPDPDDPRYWNTSVFKFSSAHPYANNTRQEFIISIPGAKRMSVYFSNLDTEVDLDKLEFFDKNGKKVGEIFGHNRALYSLPIAGDYVKVVFTSDDTVTDYGFDITKVAWE